MDDLTASVNKKNKEASKKEKFMIVVSDFYYKDSAVSLKNDLSKKILLSNIFIKKINNKKYVPSVDKVFNFIDIKEAHKHLEDRKQFGKIILVP